MKIFHPLLSLLAKSVLAATLVQGLALPAAADLVPSTNLSGTTGLIDMPSGEQQPDGYLGLDHGRFGPITRNTLTFQITPRLSGSFRYVSIRDWNAKVCPPSCSGADAFQTYYDRNFDLRYKVLNEGVYLPSVTVGLQDFIGTGLSMAEYVAATKSFGPRLKVTAGLGFGRLGSYGAIDDPLGPRPPVTAGLGGKPNVGQWFRGPMAPFGGVEYQLSDKWTLKAEYSSDAYKDESVRRGTFDIRTPLNFGVEYAQSRMVHLGLYSLYGTQIGFNISVLLNPDQRPKGGIGGPGPEPVKVRPPVAQSPDVWTTGWLAQPDAKSLLIDNMNRNLVRTGITVESISVTGTTAQIRYRNTLYEAAAQAAGRVARAMTQTMPASVETFEMVPMVNGMATSMVTVKRSDVETLEFAPDAGAVIRGRTAVTDAGGPLPDSATNPKAYPKFSWSIGPFAQTMLFDPRAPFQINAGVQVQGNYEIAPGIVLSGSVTKRLYGDIRGSRFNGTTPLPPVRSDAADYYVNADPDIATLTAAWYGKLAPELFGRVTVGYLEMMFAGISSEVLWKPVNKPYSFGVEADYVAQRDTKGGFGLASSNYRVATGFVSGYFDLGKNFTAEVDLGRYLAGDVGGTFTLMRTFPNGWQVGAFATFTNVSAKNYGEGSFDKGIKMQIPLTWFLGQPTQSQRTFILRPLGRDGGSPLSVNDRLAAVLHGYDQAGYDAQWGRFWK